MSVFNLMFSTCNINRPIITPDASGGQITNYNILAENQPCFVQPIHGQMAVFYAQRHIQVTDLVFFSIDQGLEMGDVIQFGSRKLYVEDYRNLCEMGMAWVAGTREYR